MYVPSTRKILSSYDVVFDKSFSSALAYTPRPYPEAMVMRTEVTYTPYATSSKEQTGDIITFAQFEFTSTEFKDESQTCGVRLTLAAPEHQ